MDRNDYKLTAPELLRNFLVYHETIQGHSKKTVDEYYLDLRNFFRYIKLEKGRVPRDTPLDQIEIDDLDLDPGPGQARQQPHLRLRPGALRPGPEDRRHPLLL